MNEMTPPQPASEGTAPIASAADSSGLTATSSIDGFFRLSERGTSIGREVMAGATTFAAMAYIIAVNPAIMSNAGMDRADLVSATALAAIFGSRSRPPWAPTSSSPM
jgi:adenine/guanine/hypoxanthine permease